MNSIDKQILEESYEAEMLHKMQVVIDKRVKSDVSQLKMAFYTNRSLRTIQRFESYELVDAYLVYAYTKIL